MMPLSFPPFYRHFLKRKWYHALQIASLAIGLTAIGFTILYVEHELTFDTWHPDSENVYRISYENNSGWFASLARSYSDEVYNGSIPELEAVVRFRRWPSQYLHNGNEKFYEQKVLFTDPCTRFLEFFSFPFKEGDAAKALSQSHSAVISSSLAEKLFKGKSALGESIHLDTMALTVTGVFYDLPTNTHLDFNILITNQAAMDQASGHFTYARLNKNASPTEIEKKILGLSAKSESQFYVAKTVRLINLTNLHFEGNLTYELKPAGNRTYIWILGSIGLIILIISVSNFINLSVALFAYRSKEIAVRKSIGASVTKLSSQFLVEAASFVIVSLCFCLLMMYLLTPSFNDQLQIHLTSPLQSPLFLVSTTIIAIFVTALTAIYPTLILPRIRILDLFRSAGITTHHGLNLRSALIIVQFTILFFVCCSLWLVNDQIKFIENKDLGFEKEGVLKIKRAWSVDSLQYLRLKNELTANTKILTVSKGFVPGDEDYGFQFRGENSIAIEDGLLIQNSDFDYLDALQIKPLDGVVINPDKKTWPSKLYVINETLAKMLGYEKPIGKTITLRPGTDREKKFVIQGVVKDYNFQSLHHRIPPIMIVLSEKSPYIDENIIIRVSAANLDESISFVKQKMDEIAPDVPVNIGFLDEDLDKLYFQEKRLGAAARILVIISVILSFTGLIALCSYIVQFRMKEVAIRKVFGAQSWNVILLFSKVFVKVTMIGFVIGSSIAYFSVRGWISGFAYRIEIRPHVFILTLIIILLLTIAMTVWQTLKAVRMQPAKVLKEE